MENVREGILGLGVFYAAIIVSEANDIHRKGSHFINYIVSMKIILNSLLSRKGKYLKIGIKL
jgi:hypothetical protein